MAALTHKRELGEYFAKGCRPRSSWRIGTEHEKFLLYRDSLRRFPYEGDSGICAILKALQDEGGEPVLEAGQPVAIKIPHRQVSITLEPGGQFELSGAPLHTLHQTRKELETHLTQAGRIVTSMGGLLAPFGADPLWQREQIAWVPKDRYRLMRAYMPAKGNLGLDMMTRTCTVQVNLDFENETDMVAKMRTGMALQPVATALFASSPFLEGKLNGYQIYRAHIWQDTDPDRCGILPFVFEEGMGFERYVDYLLDVPMYFVHRQGQYLDARGQSFRAFMDGHLPALPGQQPTPEDWIDQTTIAFPEVRLKQFIEMRGADSGPVEMLLALPAFWIGLLYDPIALDEAQQLVKDWSIEEIQTLYKSVPRQGLQTPFRNQRLQDIALDVVHISCRGLQRRGELQEEQDESVYLAPLMEIASSGRTVATQMVEMYKQTGSVEAVVRHYTHPTGI